MLKLLRHLLCIGILFALAGNGVAVAAPCMPSALPGISTAKAGQLLQQTDRLIKTVPEVESVFGKAGRADTATDPAPLEMFETTIQFKPRRDWRPGMHAH